MTSDLELSYSRAKTLQDCPKKYEYQFVLRTEDPAPEPGEVIVGKLIHKTLEDFHRRISRPTQADLEALPDLLEITANDYQLPPPPDGLPPAYYPALARSLIHNYATRSPYVTAEEVVAVEHEVSTVFQVDENAVHVRGIIDKVGLRDGQTVFTDYKTGKRPLPHRTPADFFQVALYAAIAPQPPTIIRYHYLRGPRIYETAATESLRANAVAWLKDQAQLAIQFEAAGHWPATPSHVCHACAYRRICPDSSARSEFPVEPAPRAAAGR